MDYIREFDIRLSKEMYYAGETITGQVVLSTMENFKLKGLTILTLSDFYAFWLKNFFIKAIKVNIRGKAHSEWKVVVNGEKRNVKDDQTFFDERIVIWGKGNSLDR